MSRRGAAEPALDISRHAPPTGSPWTMRLRGRLSSALMLLALLVGAGTAVDAAPDPMVEAVQRSLVERGFDPGKVDGAMGRRTRGALRAFQRSVGLPDTGEIGHATMTALGLETPGAGRMPAPADAPPSGAADDKPEPPVPADPSGSETPAAGTATAPDVDTPAAEATPAEPELAADASPSRSAPSRAGARDMPSEGTSATESPEPEPTPTPAPSREPKPVSKPEPVVKPALSFATLGWHRPQSGAEALERFAATGAAADFKPETGTLFVPKAGLVFVLQAGERLPGLDCDPRAGSLSIEFVFGPDGPVIFAPGAGGEYCRMGIGIALSVGRTLEMRRIDWGGVRYPAGTVRITNEGLEYVD